jgi:hypothetical protein
MIFEQTQKCIFKFYSKNKPPALPTPAVYKRTAYPKDILKNIPKDGPKMAPTKVAQKWSPKMVRNNPPHKRDYTIFGGELSKFRRYKSWLKEKQCTSAQMGYSKKRYL